MTKPLGSELMRGELVYLNRLVKDELSTVAQWMQDFSYGRHLMRNQVYPPTQQEMEEWFFGSASKQEEHYWFAVRTVHDNRLIGSCGVRDIRWQARAAEVWIGIGDPDMRGRGHGTDAMLVLLRYAFLEMNLNRVALVVAGFNEAAIASYKKVGFQHEGVMREYIFRDDCYYDMHMMSFLRREWLERYYNPG